MVTPSRGPDALTAAALDGEVRALQATVAADDYHVRAVIRRLVMLRASDEAARLADRVSAFTGKTIEARQLASLAAGSDFWAYLRGDTFTSSVLPALIESLNSTWQDLVDEFRADAVNFSCDVDLEATLMDTPEGLELMAEVVDVADVFRSAPAAVFDGTATWAKWQREGEEADRRDAEAYAERRREAHRRGLLRRKPPRRRSRPRGAGRPRGRRASSTRSCARSGDSGDDGPGEPAPLAGDSRPPAPLRTVIA